MSDRLFMNGLELDIYPEKGITENYQVNDLLDFSKRQTSFTNTFSIPTTSKNVDILEGLSLAGNTSNVPYQLNSLTYFRKGIQVFSNATAIVKKTDDEFKINAFFGNNNIFDFIENRKISQLDLSSLDHVFSTNNYFKLLNGKNIIYALADYGNLESDVIKLNQQVSAVKCSFLWDKIFAESGFSYKYEGRGGRNDFNVFETDLWNNTYISLDNGLNQEIERKPKELNIRFVNNGLYQYLFKVAFTQVKLRFVTINIPHYFYVPFEIVEQIVFSGIEVFNSENITFNNSNKVSVIKSNYYSINIAGTIVANSIQELYIRVKLNDIIIETVEISEGIFNLDFNKRYYFEANSSISFEYYMINENREKSVTFSPDLTFSFFLDNQEAVINLSNYFNDISQKDYIKDLVNFFGLTYKLVGNQYLFISYFELFNINLKYKNFNPITPVNFISDDWSEKYESFISEEYEVGKYGQRNLFKYSYDNENDTFADGVLRIENQTLEFENVSNVRLFKAPTSSPFQSGNDVLRFMQLYQVDDGKLKNVKTKPYIFYAENRSGSFKYRIGNETELQYNGDFKVATFKDLNWSEQLGKNLSPLTRVLNNAKKIEVNIRLTEIDIAELDFFKLKYIKQLGGYYYLTRIKGFTNSETTKCELVKVSQFVNFGEFSDDFSDDLNN